MGNNEIMSRVGFGLSFLIRLILAYYLLILLYYHLFHLLLGVFSMMNDERDE
jgi:hypothetical protein